jgi:hypothetical protein
LNTQPPIVDYAAKPLRLEWLHGCVEKKDAHNMARQDATATRAGGTLLKLTSAAFGGSQKG